MRQLKILTLGLSMGLYITACSGSLFADLIENEVIFPQRGADGMLLLYVSEGDFLMGNLDPTSPHDEQPQHRVYLDAFWIDQTEISNALYGKCVEAGNCLAIISPRPDRLQHPDYPVQGATWGDAEAYCERVGRRLPTEAEWEKAARGVHGALFPWGNDLPNESSANFNRQLGDVVPVGSYPEGASPYGALDMAGNVYEWVQDWYSEDYFKNPHSGIPLGRRVVWYAC